VIHVKYYFLHRIEVTGHRSVYPSQVLSLTKSSSLIVEHGREMKDIGHVIYQPRPKSVSEMLMKGLQIIKKQEKH
jgi:hypothetical protein